jgi:transposase
MTAGSLCPTTPPNAKSARSPLGGFDDGERRVAVIYTLINTAKLNDIDPQAWLADVLDQINNHPAKRIAELLPFETETSST